MLVTRSAEVHYDEPGTVRVVTDAQAMAARGAAAGAARNAWNRLLPGPSSSSSRGVVGADKPAAAPNHNAKSNAGKGKSGAAGTGAAAGSKKQPLPSSSSSASTHTFLDKNGTLCVKDDDGHVQMFASNT